MNPVRRLEPPIVELAPAASPRPVPAALDAAWSFADEPAATDGALMGKPDAALGEFPPGPSDREIAALVDEFAQLLCCPLPRRSSRRPY